MLNFRYVLARTVRTSINTNLLHQNKLHLQTVLHKNVKFYFTKTIQPHKNDPKQHEVAHKVIPKAQVSQEILHKLVNVLIISPLIKLDLRVTKIFLDGIKHKGLPHNIFSSIIQLLVVRQNQGLLEGIGRLELLQQIKLAIKIRIEGQVYEMIQSNDGITQWINQTSQKQQRSDQLNFELAVFSLTTGHFKVFADHLILIKEQQKLIKALLYLQQCPQTYRDSAVNYLKTLNITDDLRSRLAEFAPANKNADPSTLQSA